MPGGRHRKQELFPGLGTEGQAALARSTVLVAGCGATGGTIAALLVRAGVGRVRIVDRDFPELTNLGRQLLYDEADLAAGLPKAVIAREKLGRMNSEVEVEGIVADINPGNVLDLIEGVDLILDGLDNQATRYLINDAAVSRGLPWVYVGCLGSAGNVMTVIPGRSSCLRCLFPHPAPPGTLPTCDTAGIIGPAPSLVASAAAAEALKLLSGSGDLLTRGLFTFDLWTDNFRVISLPAPSPACPCCGERRFEFLAGWLYSGAATMCGIDAVQINPPGAARLNLAGLAGRLDPEALISVNKYLVRFQAEGFSFAVFPDGRVIIHGTTDHGQARALYDRYIGF